MPRLWNRDAQAARNVRQNPHHHELGSANGEATEHQGKEAFFHGVFYIVDVVGKSVFT